jgi:hypothetical protein
MMILYHGTSTQYKDRILREGLQPRAKTGVSNWSEQHDGMVESKPYLVYLTDAYPVYFALQASKEPHSLLILQVEVDEADLFPDEDFLAKVAHRQKMFPGKSLCEINPLLEPRENRHLALDCLRYNGVVAVESVPPDKIVATAEIPGDDFGTILAIGGDSMPIPLNYKFLGGAYRSAIQALFVGGCKAAVDAMTAARSF